MLTTERRIWAPTDGGGRRVHEDAGELPGNDLAGQACGRCPVNPNIDPADPVPPVVPEAALRARLKRHEGARFSRSVAAWRDHWSALTEGSRDGVLITRFTFGVPRDSPITRVVREPDVVWRRCDYRSHRPHIDRDRPEVSAVDRHLLDDEGKNLVCAPLEGIVLRNQARRFSNAS